MLNATDLADFQTAQVDGFPDRWKIVPVAATSDGLGGLENPPSIDPTEYAGRLALRSGDRREINQSIWEAADSMLHFPATLLLGVTQPKRILIQSVTYEVLYFSETRAWETARMMLLRRLS